jgi:hypothetical protein
MEILTEGQRAVIRVVAQSPLRQEFFLTGGTALSAFYLHHLAPSLGPSLDSG